MNNPYMFRRYISAEQFNLALFCSDLAEVLTAEYERIVEAATLTALYNDIHQAETHNDDLQDIETDPLSLSACFICFADWMHSIGTCLGHQPIYGEQSGDYWLVHEDTDTMRVITQLKKQLINALATVNCEIETGSGISPVEDILESRNTWRRVNEPSVQAGRFPTNLDQ